MPCDMALLSIVHCAMWYDVVRYASGTVGLCKTNPPSKVWFGIRPRFPSFEIEYEIQGDVLVVDVVVPWHLLPQSFNQF